MKKCINDENKQMDTLLKNITLNKQEACSALSEFRAIPNQGKKYYSVKTVEFP